MRQWFWGWISPFLALGVMILVQLTYDHLMGKGSYSKTDWIQSVAVLSAGLFGLLFGLYLNRKIRIVVDVDTEDTVIAQESHTIFLLPIELWGVMVLLYGFYGLFSS